MTLRVDVKITDTLTQQTRQQQRELERLYAEAYKKFLEETPVASGNARRRTSLRNKTITANYEYASRLDQGYSKQAPDGMTQPVEQWYVEQVEKIFGK